MIKNYNRIKANSVSMKEVDNNDIGYDISKSTVNELNMLLKNLNCKHLWANSNTAKRFEAGQIRGNSWCTVVDAIPDNVIYINVFNDKLYTE